MGNVNLGPRNRAPQERPVVVVHALAQAAAAARAAAEAGTAVTLASAPGAAGYAGAAWFLALLEAAAESAPGAGLCGLLDCGDDVATAFEALRAGARWVRVDGPPEALGELAGLARALGARVGGATGPVLDLAATDDADAACRAFLARAARFRGSGTTA